MKVEQSFIYIANDGKKFSTEEDCLDYERELFLRECNITFWKVDFFSNILLKNSVETLFICLVSKTDPALHGALISSYLSSKYCPQVSMIEDKAFMVWDYNGIEETVYNKAKAEQEKLILEREGTLNKRCNAYRAPFCNTGFLTLQLPEIRNVRC